jgi:hypothetical protein
MAGSKRQGLRGAGLVPSFDRNAGARRAQVWPTVPTVLVVVGSDAWEELTRPTGQKPVSRLLMAFTVLLHSPYHGQASRCEKRQGEMDDDRTS